MRLRGMSEESDALLNTDAASIPLPLRAQAVRELQSELRRTREMLDVTRQRVLRAMGEPDMGKSWSWVESAIQAKKAGVSDGMCKDVAPSSVACCVPPPPKGEIYRTPWCHLSKGHEGPHLCGEFRWGHANITGDGELEWVEPLLVCRKCGEEHHHDDC
jgi:hypothetical protein